RDGDIALDRGDGDQGAAPLTAEVWQRGARPVHVSHDVDVEDLPKVLQRCVLEGGVSGDGAHVHPRVDAAIGLDGDLRDAFDLREVRRIADHRGRLTTGVLDLADERVEARAASRGHNDLRPSRGELTGAFPPDAAGRAKDDDNLILNGLELHGIPPAVWPVPTGGCRPYQVRTPLQERC